MSSKTKSAQDWEWREGEGQADFSVPDDQTWKQMVIDDLCGGERRVVAKLGLGDLSRVGT